MVAGARTQRTAKQGEKRGLRWGGLCGRTRARAIVIAADLLSLHGMSGFNGCAWPVPGSGLFECLDKGEAADTPRRRPPAWTARRRTGRGGAAGRERASRTRKDVCALQNKGKRGRFAAPVLHSLCPLSVAVRYLRVRPDTLLWDRPRRSASRIRSSQRFPRRAWHFRVVRLARFFNVRRLHL